MTDERNSHDSADPSAACRRFFRLRLSIEDFRRWRSWGQTRRQAVGNAIVTWRFLG